MGMEEYAMWECVIPESNIKKTVPDAFGKLMEAFYKYDITIEDLAHADSFFENLDELESSVTTPYGTSEQEAVSEISEIYEKVKEDYRILSGIDVWLGCPSSDSDIDTDYFWVTELKLSRTLNDAGAYITSWAEFQ